ncbi:MAG: hypothetical protein NTW19_02560 [Planctomycetota bacterium]|nr:hypothetical protein [Planctomycetota bacterium]
MQFSPTKDGGRVASGSTPWGDYRVEWDARGRLVAQAMTARRPEGPAPSNAGMTTDAAERATRFLDERQRTFLQARRARCAECPENQGITALTVNCRGCGCTGLSFLHGACKLGRWPSEPADNAFTQTNFPATEPE